MVYDGNGYASGGANGLGKWEYSWDTFGHITSATSPYGITTTLTYDYPIFPEGELTQIQEGTKSPTLLSYYEPSGKLWQILAPKPGTVGSTQRVSLKATWSALGNLLTLTTPGNPSTTVGGVDGGITTTFNYTTDGSYSQNEALGEPLSVTDNLGNSSHLRYTPRGQVSSVVDANGNETDATYFLSGQLQQVMLPATGQSGTGRASLSYSYLYSGGPLTTASLADEGNAGVVRTYSPQWGQEGELLSVSGNLNPYSLTYDGIYRLSGVKDGNGQGTGYLYTLAGPLSKVAYPNGDTLQALTWDHNDQVLTEKNGRGQTFTYTYQDNESRLTSAQSSDSLAYDAYGRLSSLTDAQTLRSFTYDDDDLPTGQTLTLRTQVPHSFSYGYGYNDDASRSSLTLSTAGGLNLGFSYSYNGRGDLTGLSNPYGESFSWTYFANGWLQSRSVDRPYDMQTRWRF